MDPPRWQTESSTMTALEEHRTPARVSKFTVTAGKIGLVSGSRSSSTPRVAEFANVKLAASLTIVKSQCKGEGLVDKVPSRCDDTDEMRAENTAADDATDQSGARGQLDPIDREPH